MIVKNDKSEHVQKLESYSDLLNFKQLPALEKVTVALENTVDECVMEYYKFDKMTICEHFPNYLVTLRNRLKTGDRSVKGDSDFDYIRVPPHPEILIEIGCFTELRLTLGSAKKDKRRPSIPATISKVWFESLRDGARETDKFSVADIADKLQLSYVERFWSDTKPRRLTIDKAIDIFAFAYSRNWISYDLYFNEIEPALVQIIHSKNWNPVGERIEIHKKNGRRGRYEKGVYEYPFGDDMEGLFARKIQTWQLICRGRRIAFNIPKHKISTIELEQLAMPFPLW